MVESARKHSGKIVGGEVGPHEFDHFGVHLRGCFVGGALPPEAPVAWFGRLRSA